jgi:hypothetical protein
VQKEVFIDEDKETLKSSYEILHKEIQALFKENWVKIRNNELTPKPQGGGTLQERDYEIHGIHQRKRLGYFNQRT